MTALARGAGAGVAEKVEQLASDVQGQIGVEQPRAPSTHGPRFLGRRSAYNNRCAPPPPISKLAPRSDSIADSASACASAALIALSSPAEE